MKYENLRQKIFGGILPAMATPINPDSEEVSGPVVEQLVDFLINSGVNGLFVGGSTGEGILLPQDERMMLHETAITAAASRVPVLVHVGANNTRESISLAEHAASISADGIVAVTPFFYPVHDNAILDHFKAISSAAPETPFFAYDIPHMAVNGVSPDLLLRMKSDIPSFAGVKCSNPNAQKIRGLLDAASEDVMVLVGNERIALGSLALGAHGLISGLATAIPEPFVSLVKDFSAGRLEQARYNQKLINRLLDPVPAGARIGAIKEMIEQRSIAAGPPLAPRPKPSSDWLSWQQVEKWLSEGEQ
jgi:dihydrodipicolinate synthase/N-acetylneuraminate lyase